MPSSDYIYVLCISLPTYKLTKDIVYLSNIMRDLSDLGKGLNVNIAWAHLNGEYRQEDVESYCLYNHL